MKRWNPTTEQLVCRDLQHAWTPHSAAREGRGYIRVLHCLRCGSWKHQTLDQDGYIVKTLMTYPSGYLRPKGRMTKVDRADLQVRNTNA